MCDERWIFFTGDAVWMWHRVCHSIPTSRQVNDLRFVAIAFGLFLSGDGVSWWDLDPLQCNLVSETP